MGRRRRKRRLLHKQKKYAWSRSLARRKLPPIRPGQSPESVVEEAIAAARAVGVEVVKRKRAHTPGVTLLLRMHLPPRFWTVPPLHQAMWIRHELMHVFQQRDDVLFFGRWGTNQRWRSAYEIAAGYEGIATLRRLGAPKSMLRREVERQAKSYSSGATDSTYKLWRLDSKHTYKLAKRILTVAAGL